MKLPLLPVQKRSMIQTECKTPKGEAASLRSLPFLKLFFIKLFCPLPVLLFAVGAVRAVAAV